MKIKVIDDNSDIVKQTAVAGSRSYETVGIQSLDIELSTEEILKHQETNLGGPEVTRIKIEDKTTGKICWFTVRAVLKNGRPALETSPAADIGNYQKLTFGRLSLPPDTGTDTGTGTGTVKTAGKRVDHRTLSTAMLTTGLMNRS
jgi:hypothetical protein